MHTNLVSNPVKSIQPQFCSAFLALIPLVYVEFAIAKCDQGGAGASGLGVISRIAMLAAVLIPLSLYIAALVSIYVSVSKFIDKVAGFLFSTIVFLVVVCISIIVVSSVVECLNV